MKVTWWLIRVLSWMVKDLPSFSSKYISKSFVSTLQTTWLCSHKATHYAMLKKQILTRPAITWFIPLWLSFPWTMKKNSERAHKLSKDWCLIGSKSSQGYFLPAVSNTSPQSVAPTGILLQLSGYTDFSISIALFYVTSHLS